MAYRILRIVGFLSLPIAYLLLRPYMIQWAEDWEWTILLFSICLLGLEIFVIPGFGVAGFSAIVLMYAGAVLIMLQNKGLDFSKVTVNELSYALLIGGIIVSVIIVALLGLMPSILHSRHLQSLTNNSTMNKEHGYIALQNLEKMIGKEGVAETILRPSGKIIIENKLYDATTQGDFISKGDAIMVIAQDGAGLRVKKA